MKIFLIGILTLAALAAGLSGCVSSHPTDPYANISLRVRENYGTAISRSAVPQSEVGDSITIEDAIRLALDRNPELQAAAYDVTAAEARSDTLAGQRLPSLDIIGGYSRYLDSQRLFPAVENGELGAFSREIFSGDLVLSMPLFTDGRLGNQVRAADLLRQSAGQRMARTREELVFNVASVFYSILAQERLITSLEFSKKALEDHIKQVNNLMEMQKAAKVDLLRTEVRLSDVQQKLVREKNLLSIQHRLLLNIMGIEDSGARLTLKGTLEKTAPELKSMDDDVARALQQRPDFQAARRELEAQGCRVDVARAGQSPTVNIFASYGGRWAMNPTQQPAGAADSGDVGKIGLNLQIPLFEGGRIQAAVREERAKLMAAQARFRKLELSIRLEVETAYSNMTSAFERVQTAEKTIEQARESLRIEREKYDLGKGAILDVLDAQSALLETETNYYRALADLNISKAQRLLVIGD